MQFRSVEWIGGRDGFVRLLDQTLLPARCEYIDIHDVEAMWQAIKVLIVRGAPAIGVAAAFGVVLGLRSAETMEQASLALQQTCDTLVTSRPTAVNLPWALQRMRDKAPLESKDVSAFRDSLLQEAQSILDEDIAMCKSIGEHGATLLDDGDGVLTHCNAGALATGGYGTALSVIYAAAEKGCSLQVYADETRPLLQGSRLTAWELMQNKIDVTLISDSMAAWVMKLGRIQKVITGADRIAGNGDAANKIGTYAVALAAKEHAIPFYIAAPYSTFDGSLASGADIPIEERSREELVYVQGQQTAPTDVKTFNPAFDVTPAAWITGIITEQGILYPPYEPAIAELLRGGKSS